MTMSDCMLVTKKTNESRIYAWAHGLSTWMMDSVSFIWKILQEHPYSLCILTDT